MPITRFNFQFELNLNLILENISEMENKRNDESAHIPLKTHFIPSIYTPTSCINLPEIGASHYEIKSSTIEMLPTFYGLNNEDSNNHIDEFLEICSTVKIQNFTDDALKLTLFLFPLKDKGKH